jgi:transcriptional regulator with XRE-family HTH domain
MTTTGERLKQARRHTGWRQTDLAQAANVGIATVRRIEQETMDPRLSTARRIADALGIRVEWLLFGVGVMTDKHNDEGGSP